MSTDVSSLPTPAVVEPLDFEAINAAHQADLLARHPAAADVQALESEPLTKLIEAHAYRELLFRARVNEAARARLLEFAAGADLDHLGDLYGAPRLPGEPDERYRTRLRLVIRALAGNGTREAYESRALAASLDVRSARAIQPQPGSVLVLVWPRTGADAQATLALVRAALTHDSARVLGVPISVALARPRPIDVHATIVREPGAPTDLAARLAATLPAQLDGWTALGRDVPRSWITARLHVAGVAAVHYADPQRPHENTALDFDQYPVAGSIVLTDGGVA